MLFVPTELGRIERVVNSFPMRLGIHSFPTGKRLAHASSLKDVLTREDVRVRILSHSVPFHVFKFLPIDLAARGPFLENFKT